MLINFTRCSEVMSCLYGRKATKVYHIGAHIGEEATAYHENGVTDVCWFEANPQIIPQLQAAINTVDMKQTIVPYALWNKNEKIKLNISSNFQSSSVFEFDKHQDYYPNIVYTDAIEMDAFRLDSFISLADSPLPFADFDFINLDTQGAEFAILEGLGEYIKSPSLMGIYVEVNRETLYKDIPLIDELDRFLEGHGFIRLQTAWTNAGWGDALYVRKIEN
ncbi:FkbM family methyltransferase [sulfur-oxidizing endosymbiont of Gigantopelta aegis]|uniref:FkbM family methyltransferase n=1 Tax=sulfur-oxidizing endosymbiont of Gigantopelta aegis TaxID=2794934 RepID=UPI0018DBC5D8|nr:FkbM family methyltransferase [sulfur-oxidizing endosymbiont of Gigantopelta aegis]